MLTTKEAARVLGMSHRTLQRWRYERRGPPHYRVGKALRYRLEDLHEYLEKRRVDPNSAAKRSLADSAEKRP